MTVAGHSCTAELTGNGRVDDIRNMKLAFRHVVWTVPESYSTLTTASTHRPARDKKMLSKSGFRTKPLMESTSLYNR